jgi:hypothetical protein
MCMENIMKRRVFEIHGGGALHVLWFFAVGSWVTWFFSCWERKICLQRWANSQNDNYFCSKWSYVVILRENRCHFVNLHSFESSYFFLSLRKITWLNSKQPKTRTHVEHPTSWLTHFWFWEKVVLTKNLDIIHKHPN